MALLVSWRWHIEIFPGANVTAGYSHLKGFLVGAALWPICRRCPHLWMDWSKIRIHVGRVVAYF